MAKKIEKTNAARLLDKAGIKYSLIPYEVDENDLAAQHVADSLGQNIECVFKTLILHGDKTGYIRGGCSPIGMKKRFPTYFHNTALDFEIIYVSAGVRGLQLEISPSELIGFVDAQVADIASFEKTFYI